MFEDSFHAAPQRKSETLDSRPEPGALATGSTGARFKHRRPLLELIVWHQRKSAVVLIQFDRACAVRHTHLDRAVKVVRRLPPGLKFDFRTHLLHRGVDSVKRFRKLSIEIVIVEHAARSDRLTAVAHDSFREARIAVALSGAGPQ